jgi:hypothetical protein
VKDLKFFCIVVLVIVASSIPIMASEYRSDQVIVKFKTKLPQGISAMALADERPMTIAVDNADEAIAELKGVRRRVVAFLGERSFRTEDGIEALSVRDFLHELEAKRI